MAIVQSSRARRRRDLRRLAMILASVSVFISALVLSQEQKTSSPAVVSPVVYPSAKRIRFDHAKHAGQSCVSCHRQATSSSRATDILTPPMTACAGCHGEKGSAKLKLNDCGGCHVGYSVVAQVSEPKDWRAVRPAPMIVKRPSANLRFDHSKHVQISTNTDAGCLSCHSASAKMPSMASCNTCHNDQIASATCSSCHPTDDRTKRVRTTFKVNGVAQTLKPDNHDIDWKKRHGPMAKSSPNECASCHQEADCADCHTEQVAKPYTVHVPNYIVMHAIDARSDMGNCTDCHTVDNFCTTCHVRSNVTMQVGASPPPRAQFHPPGWLDGSMPNNHGVMARRNIDECASCHMENDCISCHTGINPHPPEFALNCGTLLSANPTPCAKCHQDLSALRTMCR